jgi:hypothetical protein
VVIDRLFSKLWETPEGAIGALAAINHERIVAKHETTQLNRELVPSRVTVVSKN